MSDAVPPPAVVPLGYRRGRRRRELPLVLVGLGVYLLVGCIPIPSTQQYMTNGQLKLSYAVGSGASSPIRLGYTTIDQAADVLAGRLINPPAVAAATGEARAQMLDRAKWGITRFADGRHWAVPYTLRTGYLISLCGPLTLSESKFLVFDVDDRGVVTDYHTVDYRGLQKFGSLNEATRPYRSTWTEDWLRPPTTRTTTTRSTAPATSRP